MVLLYDRYESKIMTPTEYWKSQCCGSVLIESRSGYGFGSNISSESGSGYGSGSNPDPGFWWPRSTAGNFSFFFWSQIAIYLSLGLHKGRPSYRRSLAPSKQNIQHLKKWYLLPFFYFGGPFLPSWIRIANPGTDPETPLNPDPIRIRIHNTAENPGFCIRHLGVRIPEEHLILGQRLVVEDQGDRPLHLKILIF